MRVLLTGAAGFVGRHVARSLAAAGCETFALVRRSANLSCLDAVLPRVTVVCGDLSDGATLDEVARLAPELCIHTAWFTNSPDYLDSPLNIESMAETLRLASRLGGGGCRRFVGVGTCIEYGASRERLPESAPLGPAHLYSACKVGAWHAVEQIGRLSRMEVAWARLFHPYGPWERAGRLVPSLLTALLQGKDAAVSPGAQVRDFMHVADVASALVAVATSSLVGPVNVASGVPVSVADLARAAGQILGRPSLVKVGAVPYRPGDPMFVCADTQRLTTECGWTPRFSLEAGLLDTADWWRGQRAEGADAGPGSP